MNHGSPLFPNMYYNVYIYRHCKSIYMGQSLPPKMDSLLALVRRGRESVGAPLRRPHPQVRGPLLCGGKGSLQVLRDGALPPGHGRPGLPDPAVPDLQRKKLRPARYSG